MDRNKYYGGASASLSPLEEVSIVVTVANITILGWEGAFSILMNIYFFILPSLYIFNF